MNQSKPSSLMQRLVYQVKDNLTVEYYAIIRKNQTK